MKPKRKGTLCYKQFSYMSAAVDYFNEHPEYDIVSHAIDTENDVFVMYYRYDNIRNKHKNNE